DGLHMMADVDIFEEESKLPAGATVLRSLGYFLPRAPTPHAHAWTFHRQMSLATIDLHRHVGPQRNILSPQEAQQAAVPLSNTLRGLSPTHRALMLLMSFGIFERHYWNGHIPLKGLHDFAALQHRHGDRIDWKAIIKAAELHHFSVSARAFLHL